MHAAGPVVGNLFFFLLFFPLLFLPCLRDLDKEAMRNVGSFRLRAHGLNLESYKWLGGSNVCDECAEVQDEIHALFYCNCFE
eukprot:189893-Pelagomonas_calceolata.AAC.1